jgi:hypothetical protein
MGLFSRSGWRSGDFADRCHRRGSCVVYYKMRSPRQPPSRWYASAGHSWPSSSGRHRLLDTSVVTLALPRVGEQMSSDLLGTLRRSPMSTTATCHPESAPVPGRGVQAGIEVGGERRGAGPGPSYPRLLPGSSRPAGGVTSGQVSPGIYGDRCGAVAGGAAWRARQGGRLATGGTTEGRLGCRAKSGL